MSKTTRKGIKVGIPHIAEGWYEETIEGLKEGVRKRRGGGLFKRQKDEVDLGARFRDFLLIAEKDVEMYLWYAKGFAIRNALDRDVDYRLDHLFSRVISVFNDLLQRFEPSNLSDDLLNHLKRELKMLHEQASRLWNIESLKPESNPKAKEDAVKMIETFERNLWDFGTRMEPYLKKEEPDKDAKP
jgi:hypothetical protein